jgi:SAM-dependent methyltransferase
MVGGGGMSFKINKNIGGLIQLQRTWANKMTLSEIGRFYWESCCKDFEQIKHFFNPGTTALDIGCGLAGVDFLLMRDINDMDITLFDLDRVDTEIRYGYSWEPSAYNTRAAVVDFYQLNGTTMPRYVTAFPVDLRFDVIISLISYGFHYPVETYLKEVIETLKPGGVLVLDIRKNSGQVEKICRFFRDALLIEDTKSYFRMAFSGLYLE